MWVTIRFTWLLLLDGSLLRSNKATAFPAHQKPAGHSASDWMNWKMRVAVVPMWRFLSGCHWARSCRTLLKAPVLGCSFPLTKWPD